MSYELVKKCWMWKKIYGENSRCWFFWSKVEWFNLVFELLTYYAPLRNFLFYAPLLTPSCWIVNKISRFHVKFFECITTGESGNDTFSIELPTPIRLIPSKILISRIEVTKLATTMDKKKRCIVYFLLPPGRCYFCSNEFLCCLRRQQEIYEWPHLNAPPFATASLINIRSPLFIPFALRRNKYFL